MFSGKTEELLRRAKRDLIAKKKIVLLKPKLDTRYEKNEIVTHYRTLRLPCYRINHEITKFSSLSKELQQKILLAEKVYIDEGQFFSQSFLKFVQELIEIEKDVIVVGLDLDFRAEPFGSMPILLALADEVIKLHAVCVVCGKEATRTQRLINGKPAKKDSPLILIGGEETYEARCSQCYEPPC